MKDDKYYKNYDITKVISFIKSVVDNKVTENQIDTYVEEMYNFESDDRCSKECKDIRETLKDVKIDLVKGTIYKIKEYFLDNNTIKEIRGGSKIVEYLNSCFVKEQLEKNIFKDKETQNEFSLNENNIIYCGGGNVFLMVPEGVGESVCRFFEKSFTQLTLTMKNAFEFDTVSLNDFAFNYTNVRRKLDDKLTIKTKMKIYNPNYYYDWNNIDFNKEKMLGKNYKDVKYDKLEENEVVVCKSCDIRDAKYKISTGSEERNLCPSCLRKYIAGHEGNDSIDKLSEDKEIAVIYGDGNNMGNIVSNIKNVFEMMSFSRKTEEITKEVVEEAVRNNVKDFNTDWEKIALGGDDIFIIVPANKALQICKEIIEKFEERFNKEYKNLDKRITMSVGVVISKSNTPVASLFSIAQKALKNAKNLVKGKSYVSEKEEDAKEINQGSIDVIELLGDMHVQDLGKNREFPLVLSDFKAFLNGMSEITTKLNTQLNKISYAKETMIEEEFNLFYYYQQSKDNKVNILIKNLYGDDKENHENRYCRYRKIERNKEDEKSKETVIVDVTKNPYYIYWKDIILMKKRGVR